MIVWQKAMELVEETYQISRKLPREELYALSDQMRRAAVSIPSNIAEGSVRKSVKEYLSFLAIARGSNAELETQLQIIVRLNYVKEEEILKALALTDEVGRMLRSIAEKLNTDT